MPESSSPIRNLARFLSSRAFSAILISSLLIPSLLARARQETVLYNFTGGLDGSGPSAIIRNSSTGVLYGTTPIGGCGGYGVVFKMSPGGTQTVIHCFAGLADGALPYAAPVQDSAGTIYGSASEGGDYTICTDSGCGTIFKVNPDPPFDFTILHTFTGATNDGQAPNAVMLDAAGNMFGTAGGGELGWGIVFKIDTAGKFSVLYNFTNGSDGGEPVGSLVEDAAGNLYGLTHSGGASKAGVIFKISGTTESVLHNFSGGADGGFATGYDGHPILDSAGNLYGAAFEGGIKNPVCPEGCGVIFRLSPSGQYTVLHSFTAHGDGAYPNSSLLRTASGVLYGTSLNVAYALAPSGSLTVLHTFAGGTTDGTSPNGGLAMDEAGTLYGSTSAGGTGCCNGVGVVFKILK